MQWRFLHLKQFIGTKAHNSGGLTLAMFTWTQTIGIKAQSD